jgi:hypothetical protein
MTTAVPDADTISIEAAGRNVFIIEVDADHGIAAEAPRLLFHFASAIRALAQRFLVGARRPPTISRMPAKKSRKMLAPRIA